MVKMMVASLSYCLKVGGWEGARLIRNPSKALLPCVKVIEDMNFLFTTLHGAQSSRDFVRDLERIHSFIRSYFDVVGVFAYSSVGCTKVNSIERLCPDKG